mmetsp:Transcript_9259/g.8142  ORF Transcript_9259/g.8142 Transcript_9259/m.8142 type:complete len:205 (+) Transcript_9259:121-735(+)
MACPIDTTKVDTVKIYKANTKPKTVKLIKKLDPNKPKDSSLSNLDDLKNNLTQCKNTLANFSSVMKNNLDNIYILSNKESIINKIKIKIDSININISLLPHINNEEYLKINIQIISILNELEYNNLNMDILVNYLIEDGQIVELDNTDDDYKIQSDMYKEMIKNQLDEDYKLAKMLSQKEEKEDLTNKTINQTEINKKKEQNVI